MINRFAFIIILFHFGINANAHGDLHIRIAKVSLEIKNYPDSSSLFMKRGLLYAQHEEFEKALLDYDKSLTLGYKDVHLLYNLANLHFRMGEYQKSILVINDALTLSPNHVMSLKLQGHVFFKMGQFEEAADLFLKVINYADATFPENYLDASWAFEKCNAPRSSDLSVAVIQKGIERVGPLRVFYDRLVELYEMKGDLESAVYYQTLILDQSERKEFPYFIRAKLYMISGNEQKAKSDLLLSKSLIENLKPNLKSRYNVQSLLSSIEDLILKFEN